MPPFSILVANEDEMDYLLGETDQENIFKNPDMLRRLNDIEEMDDLDRSHVLFTIDALIQKVKLRSITQ